jgi:hypothetical protein
MYISRPPISVSSDPQKSPKTSVNGLTPEKPTTAMVKDRDDSLRHPVTRKFTSRWQNEQSSEGPDEADEIGKKDDGRGASWKKNSY